MTKSEPVGNLDGRHKARFEHVPPESDSSAIEVLDFLDLINMPLMGWQRRTLSLQLGEDADGSWSAPWVVEIVPRQNGKTYKWAARVLAGLFVLGEDLITYTAQNMKTAMEVFNLVDRMAREHPETAALIKRTARATGREFLELTTGQRFQIIARARAAGRGFTGDCLIMDEALEIRDQQAINALLPTLTARPNPQLIFTSSAGDPGSVVLKDLRDRGRDGSDPDMCYIEYSAPDDADPDDEAAWHMANPSLGQLIPVKAIRRARSIMSPDGFRQEHLGIWSGETTGVIIPAPEWEATTNRHALDPIPGQCGLAFDVTPAREWGTVVVAYPADGKTHVRILRHDNGDGWLVEQIVGLHQQLQTPVWFDDAGPARDVAAVLRNAGVPVKGVSRRDYAAASAGFLSGIVNHTITHHPDKAMDDAAKVASTRTMGDAWYFARKTPGMTPISPISAAAMAAWAVIHPEPVPVAPTRPQVL